VITSLHTEWSV